MSIEVMQGSQITEQPTKYDAMVPLDNNQTTFLAAKKGKGILGIHKYTYDIVTFVPQDIVDGPRGFWFMDASWLKEDVKLGAVNFYANPETALEAGQYKLDQRNQALEQGAAWSAGVKKIKDTAKTVWNKISPLSR